MTLRFRADNFEAVATELRRDGTGSLYVVTAGGAPAYSLLVARGAEVLAHADWRVEQYSDRNGWLRVCWGGDERDALALAISLLYSVPGVEVCDE